MSSNTTQDQRVRSSCDACAAAKVKCSQNRPRCQRCSTHDVECIYGLSRRHGRPGSKRTQDNPTRTNATVATMHARRTSLDTQLSSRSSGEFMRHSVSGTSLSNGLDQMATGPAPPPNYGVFDMSSLDDAASVSSTGMGFNLSSVGLSGGPAAVDTSMPMDEDPPAPHTEFSNPFDNLPVDPDFSFDASTGFFNFTDMYSPSNSAAAATQQTSVLPQQPQKQQKQSQVYQGESPRHGTPKCPRRGVNGLPEDCNSVAAAIIASFQFGEEGGINGTDGGDAWLTSVGAQDLSFGHVVRTTHAAICGVECLLCCSCATVPHMAMLYFSIVSQALCWYRAAAGVAPSPNQMSGQSDTSSSSPNSHSTPQSGFSSSSSRGSLAIDTSAPINSDLMVQVSIEPIKIGGYTPAAEHQEAMRRALLQQKLQYVERLIDRFIKLRSETAASKPLVSNLYRNMSPWLRSELDKTIDLINKAGILKNGPYSKALDAF